MNSQLLTQGEQLSRLLRSPSGDGERKKLVSLQPEVQPCCFSCLMGVLVHLAATDRLFHFCLLGLQLSRGMLHLPGQKDGGQRRDKTNLR